ncbi:hypothetical protein NQ318_020151 [Aromia moschata]|uniref:Uncharacterized protein n=1 Tax=Aromia moschata TaxID=1265417 RepID=A0AAV8ZA93_9CUCU|nr:hypothetical protein NQ318_020151 [Aromia moschata]
MLSKPVKTRFWKKPRKTLADVLKREAKEFCLQTALHGYRFIVLPKKVLLERQFIFYPLVTWSAVCVASLITAFVLLFIAWFNFQANPTVLITDSTHYAIWNYPFPAVTICDYNVISKKKALALAETLSTTRPKYAFQSFCFGIRKAEGRTPQEMAWDLRLLFQLVKYTDPDVPQENYTWIRNIVEENGLSIGDLLDELSPSCEELLTNCRWKGEPKRCEHLFERVLTTEGFCCSFNYYALRNHTFNRMIASKVPTKPRRVSACGHQTALEVTALINPSDYFAAHLPSFGHRILVHNPYQFPDWSWQEILSEINTLLLVSVSPTLTYSSADIRSLPIRSRGCLFTDEMNLDNFNGYNFHNCMMRCRMNLTISLCGCRPYYSGNGTRHFEQCA